MLGFDDSAAPEDVTEEPGADPNKRMLRSALKYIMLMLRSYQAIVVKKVAPLISSKKVSFT